MAAFRSIWRVMPGVSAALLAFSALAFGLATVESEAGVTLREFGYAGETLRAVVVDVSGAGGSVAFAAEVDDLCYSSGLSVAYSSTPEARVVGVCDPLFRFRDRTEPLFGALASARREPAAVISSRWASAEPTELPPGMPLNVKRLGLFSPNIQFDSVYPVVLETMQAARPSSGVYLVAGLSAAERRRLEDFFAHNGFQVVNLAVQSPYTLGHIFSTAYGRVVILFALLSVLAALFVTSLNVALDRSRLVVAAVLGASVGDLRRILLRRLAPPVIIGTAGGVVAALAVMLQVWTVMQVEFSVIVWVCAGTVLGCGALWSALLLLVSVVESWRCWKYVSP